jgi:hypothetical protein
MIQVDARDKETAKREKLVLFQIAVDGRYAETVEWRGSEIRGACTVEQAEMLRALIHGWPDHVEDVYRAIQEAKKTKRLFIVSSCSSCSFDRHC